MTNDLTQDSAIETYSSFRINETLQTGAVENRTYRAGGRKCSFIFRIHHKNAAHLAFKPIRSAML